MTTESTTTEELVVASSTFTDDLIRLLDRTTAPDVDHLVAELRDVMATVERVAPRCAEVLGAYEHESTRLHRALRNRYPDLPVAVDDGVHEFFNHVSGRRALWDLLSDLSVMLDPDDMTRAASIEAMEEAATR